MAREPIVIHDQVFDSQKAAQEFFGEILNSSSLNEPVQSEDFDRIVALLARHPEAHEKIGAGVRQISVRRVVYGTRCFWLTRTDGTETDFSYLTCVKGKGPTLDQEYLQACRSAVEAALRKAKQNHFELHADAEGRVRCDISGVPIGIQEAHLDHAPPVTFEVIAAFFRRERHIDPSYSIITPPADKQFQAKFIEPALARDFESFHREHARLRIVAKKLNLALSSKNRVRPPKNAVAL
jgi:hypothetical protein